jgi:HEAT repeat protein
LVEGASRWAELLRTTAGSDRIAVVRASAAHPSQAVTHELIQLLENPDREVAAAAAVALGVPGNGAAVAPLATLLGDPESRVRMAAIRGLGRIATDGARQALEAAATSHPDAATRRRAAAEVALMTRQSS